MKVKHVLTVLGLSLVMGVATGGAVSMAKAIKPAFAGSPVNLYFDVSSTSWWNNDGAETYAHCFGGSVADTSWPGAKMELVAGSSTKYVVEIDDSYTSVIFTRVNPSDHTTVWNRTSKDGGTAINLPGDYSVSNQWNLTADGSSYDDGNYCGNWSLYTPPAVTYTVHVFADETDKGNQTVGEGELPTAPALYGKTFVGWFDNEAMTEGHEVTAINGNTTVYGKYSILPTLTYYVDFSKGEIGTFEDRYFYAFESNERRNADWPGEVIGNFPLSITVPNDATIVINAGQDKEQTVNIPQSGIDNDTLYVLDTKTDGKYNYLWQSSIDEPEYDNTYYLVGSKTNWKYKNALAMSTSSYYLEDNTAIYLGYDAQAGEEIKARGVFAGVDKWYGVGGEGGENLVFESAGTYDIFLNASKELSAAPAVERHEAHLVCFKYAGSEEEGTEQFDGIIYEGTPYVPQASIPGYICRGFFYDGNFSSEYTPTNLNSSQYLYGKFTKSCYYLVGDDAFMGAGHGWNVDYATAVAAGSGSNRLVGTVTIPESADAEHPVAVKPLLYTLVTDGAEDPNGTPGWKAEYYTLGEERTFVTLDGSGNFAFTVPGTYAFYVNNENAVYFNIGEYAFHAKFLSEVGGACSGVLDGTKTVEQLQAVWAEQKAAYAALSAEDQQKIKAVGFANGDEHSADDRLQMIAKYAYIVNKYGTALFEDFIWNQTIASNTIGLQINNNNTVLLVVVLSTATVIVSAGLLFYFLRKRRYN